MKDTGYIREREIAKDPRWPLGLEELRRARRENRIRYTPGCRTYWYRPEWIESYIATKKKGPPHLLMSSRTLMASFSLDAMAVHSWSENEVAEALKRQDRAKCPELSQWDATSV